MIRKLLVPLAATALLAGCVTTAPYGYRDGSSGDYYYGSPSVEYRYSGYGDPYYGYGPYRPGFSVWGGAGYPGYYDPYYAYPYYSHPYSGHPRPRPEPPRPSRPHGGPWRNLGIVGPSPNGEPPRPGIAPASESAWRDAQRLIHERRGGTVGPSPAPVMPQVVRPHGGFGDAAPMPRVSSPTGDPLRRVRRAGSRND